jgi:hypothetical protein
MADIIKFPKTFNEPLTTDKVPINKVLSGADKANLKETVVIGYDEKGDFYFASSEADGPSVLWLLESAKKELLNVTFNPEDIKK